MLSDWELKTLSLFGKTNKRLDSILKKFSDTIDQCLRERIGCFCFSRIQSDTIQCTSCGIEYHQQCVSFNQICPCCDIQVGYNPLGKHSLLELTNQTTGIQQQREFWELKRILSKLHTWLAYIDDKLDRSPDQKWLRNSLRLFYSLEIYCPQTKIIETMLMNSNDEEPVDMLDALATIAFGILNEEVQKRKSGSSEEPIRKRKKIPETKEEKSTDVEEKKSPALESQTDKSTYSQPQLLTATPPIPSYQHYYSPHEDVSTYYGYYPHSYPKYHTFPYKNYDRGYESQYPNDNYSRYPNDSYQHDYPETVMTSSRGNVAESQVAVKVDPYKDSHYPSYPYPTRPYDYDYYATYPPNWSQY